MCRLRSRHGSRSGSARASWIKTSISIQSFVHSPLRATFHQVCRGRRTKQKISAPSFGSAKACVAKETRKFSQTPERDTRTRTINFVAHRCATACCRKHGTALSRQQAWLIDSSTTTACIPGTGKAGKVGELICQGGLYKGEILAGQPNGKGNFFSSQVVSTAALLHAIHIAKLHLQHLQLVAARSLAHSLTASCPSRLAQEGSDWSIRETGSGENVRVRAPAITTMARHIKVLCQKHSIKHVD